MDTGSIVSFKAALWVAGALLAGAVAAPNAGATTVRINFSGTAGSGYADLTLAPDPNASANYQPTYNAYDGANGISAPLSKYDPAGAQYITGAVGSFNGVPITGVMANDQGQAPPGEILPASFSWNYASSPYDLSSALDSYDNLFYPAGSPLVCPPTVTGGWPFSGGFLDIYGVMFLLGDNTGESVLLWSDGVTAAGTFGPTWPGGLTYGLDVFTPNASGGGYSVESSEFSGAYAAVPEPRFAWIFGAALLGLFAWRRSAEVGNAAHRVA